MSLIDDLKKLLEKKKTASPQEQSQLMEQLKRERDLYDLFKASGLSVSVDDLQGRARLRPEGILTKVEKVDLIDLITKINEITTIKTLENLDLIKVVSSITDVVNIQSLDLIDNITTIGTINQILEARLIQDKSALEGTDVDEVGSGYFDNSGWGEILSYDVPTGKTLLIYDWSVILLTASGNVAGELAITNPALNISFGAGAQGFQTPFSKPKRIASQKNLRILGRHYQSAAQTLIAHFGGILV